MKKKSLLIAGLFLVSACSLAFAFGCKDNSVKPEDPFANPADDWVLQSIELDVSNVKLEYDYNEAFNASQKPVVTATYATLESVITNEENKLYETSSSRLVTEKRAVPANEIVVDYSQYDQTAVGVYNIYVSYTYAGVSRSSSYKVEVKSDVPGFGGITAVTAEGFVTEYTIEGQDGVNIDLAGLEFHTVGSDLTISETALASDAYTLEYFLNGTTKIDSLNGITEKGTYTIMATHENSGVKSKAFVAVSVLNPITGFVIKDGYKNEQIQSPVDELTSTWVFTVSYSSGKSVDLKKGDAGLIIGNPVTVTAADRISKVTYTEDEETRSLDIAYTITKNDKLENEENVYDKAAFGITSGGDVKLTQANLTGANSFLTKGDAGNVTLTYRPGTDDGVLEFKNDALKIEFKGFGSLKVSVRSTSNANNSGVALKDENGNFVTALYDAADSGITAGTYEDREGEVYAVTGSLTKPVDARYLTFIIPEAGVYTLCTVNKVTVGDTDIDTGRNARVYVIEQVDVFDASVDRVSYSFDINANSVKKDYVAGQTEEDITIEGLTAEFTENHSDESIAPTKTPLTAADVTFALTSGDMSKLNTTGTVTVTYTANGKEYKKTYDINIKSPVSGVNKVALTADKPTVSLDSADATYTLNKNDIVLHANSATGVAITLGEGESVEYKLYNGETELESWTGLGAGVYTVKAVVVLNNNEKLGGENAVVPGTTTFIPDDLTITVKEYVPAGNTGSYESFFIPNVEGEFTATSYDVNAEIADNSLFTIAAGTALKTSQGKDGTMIQNGGGSNKVEFTDTKGTTHNPNVGIAQIENGSPETWFTVTAKEDINLVIYVTFANMSYNSNKAGSISYKVNGEGGESKDLSARKTVWAVQVELNKGDVVTFASVSTLDSEGKPVGMAWLFGAEAEQVVPEVTEESFFIPNVEGEFTATAYAANAEITDNSLFTIAAGTDLTTSQGKDGTMIQNGGGSNKVEFTDTKGTTHNPNVGIALTDNGSPETWFTVTAKEDINLVIYVTFANKSYNSNKAGSISYKVNGEGGESKDLSARKTVWTVQVELNKGDVVTFASVSTLDSEGKPVGMAWLFGAEAETK